MELDGILHIICIHGFTWALIHNMMREIQIYRHRHFSWTGLEKGESKVARWHRKLAKTLRKNSYQGKKESGMAISQQGLRIRWQQRYSEAADKEISSQSGYPSGNTHSTQTKDQDHEWEQKVALPKELNISGPKQPPKLSNWALHMYFLPSQETAKFYSNMKIKSIRMGVKQQGPEWMQQKCKWNDTIEAYINSWTDIRNSSGFPKIFVEWWDFERYWNSCMSLEVKSSGTALIDLIHTRRLVRFWNVWGIMCFFWISHSGVLDTKPVNNIGLLFQSVLYNFFFRRRVWGTKIQKEFILHVWV